MGDEEEERVRRIFQLFYGLRGVDRRFYLSTSVDSKSHKNVAETQYQHPCYGRYIYRPICLM